MEIPSILTANCFNWSSRQKAADRRSSEERNQSTVAEFFKSIGFTVERKGDSVIATNGEIEANFSYNETCGNVYKSLSITKNGKKSNITAIKKLLTCLALSLCLFASCKESRAIKIDSIETVDSYNPSFEPSESLNFKAVHEAAHYVVYEKVMQKEGFTPSSRSLSIIDDGKTGGSFVADDYGNWKTEVITFLAGYATRVVFYGESAESVFADIKANNRIDYRAAVEARGNDEMTFDDFKAAIAWVAAYKGKIASVANRLQKEKFIKL